MLHLCISVIACKLAFEFIVIMFKRNPTVTSFPFSSWSSYKEFIFTLLCPEISPINTPSSIEYEKINNKQKKVKPVYVTEFEFLTFTPTRLPSIRRLRVIASSCSETDSCTTSPATLTPPAPTTPSTSLSIVFQTITSCYILASTLTSSIDTPLR